MSRWELGTSTPRPDFLVKLARALDIPALRLIHLDGEIPDLRALRLQAGLTVPELVARTNLTAPTYYSWEQGRWTRLPGPATIETHRAALSASPPTWSPRRSTRRSASAAGGKTRTTSIPERPAHG